MTTTIISPLQELETLQALAAATEATVTRLLGERDEARNNCIDAVNHLKSARSERDTLSGRVVDLEKLLLQCRTVLANKAVANHIPYGLTAAVDAMLGIATPGAGASGVRVYFDSVNGMYCACTDAGCWTAFTSLHGAWVSRSRWEKVDDSYRTRFAAKCLISESDAATLLANHPLPVAAPAQAEGNYSSIVRKNAEIDPSYSPYCLRCSGLQRMAKIEAFHWRCEKCGAVHDERIAPAQAEGHEVAEVVPINLTPRLWVEARTFSSDPNVSGLTTSHGCARWVQLKPEAIATAEVSQ